ncbi:MAG TPA: hypothetical protein PLU22_11810, partial [Polyangiaceae bacterium]|nr:hypothetical protein [Polyangiaceae bacterium]
MAADRGVAARRAGTITPAAGCGGEGGVMGEAEATSDAAGATDGEGDGEATEGMADTLAAVTGGGADASGTAEAPPP